MKWLAVGAILLVAVGAILGCGGSDDAPQAVVGKAQFLKRANAICQAGEDQRLQAMTAAGETFKPAEPEAKQQEKILFASLPPYEKTVEKLRDLDPPKGDEETVGALLDEMETAAEQSRAAPRETLESSVAIFRKTSQHLVSYGLDECDLIGAGSAG